MTKREYIIFLNVFSALAVVLLHANSCFWGFSYEKYWISANIIESVFYFAVPVFFMISGATLLDYNKRYSTITFFKKRIAKTLIPFVAWSIIGLFYMIYTGRVLIEDIGERWLINSFFNTNIISIYWYFIPQFAVYMLIPFIAAIPAEKRKTPFSYIIVLILLFNVTFPLLFAVVGLNYNGAINIPLGGYSMYVLIGYYIDRYEIGHKFRYCIYILGMIGVLVHILGTWKLSYAAGEIVSLYKGYLNLPCVLYSVSIYTFFRYQNEKQWLHKLNRAMKIISGTTLGIYLIHWYLLDFFMLHITAISPQSLIYRLGGGISCFMIAALLTKVLQKIPIIRHIVPQ